MDRTTGHISLLTAVPSRLRYTVRASNSLPSSRETTPTRRLHCAENWRHQGISVSIVIHLGLIDTVHSQCIARDRDTTLSACKNNNRQFVFCNCVSTWCCTIRIRWTRAYCSYTIESYHWLASNYFLGRGLIYTCISKFVPALQIHTCIHICVNTNYTYFYVTAAAPALLLMDVVAESLTLLHTCDNVQYAV